MTERLTGKSALVTGAAQGIGEGIALALAHEGARVLVADINGEGAHRVADACGGRAIGLDVAVEDDWVSAARFIEDHWSGEIDILVNNAGVEFVKPASEMSLSEWRKVMSINVDGVFLGCKTLAPLLALAAGRTGHAASVVNISSIAGLIGYPDQLAYNTSKGAVRHMSKSLAIEWASHGMKIRCNSIHPGFVRTPMIETLVHDWTESGIVPTEDPWGAVASYCPLNAIGSPEDIAMGVIYLASNEAKFVTGIELVIDGGYVAR